MTYKTLRNEYIKEGKNSATWSMYVVLVGAVLLLAACISSDPNMFLSVPMMFLYAMYCGLCAVSLVKSDWRIGCRVVMVVLSQLFASSVVMGGASLGIFVLWAGTIALWAVMVDVVCGRVYDNLPERKSKKSESYASSVPTFEKLWGAS